ncbi:hypothetical protein [Candidatus Spongiihabitans sp.]|uniref:hypothetical protein n=1 Tax=Candidatus Spongiihabitans sp. TaxID=3101308 RepID=UPI003C7B49EC
MSGTIICRPPGKAEVQIMSGTIICRPPGKAEVPILQEQKSAKTASCMEISLCGK